ncbi:MAG: hypothetical protein AAFR70_06975 [Pseudomonadota bacterium]
MALRQLGPKLSVAAAAAMIAALSLLNAPPNLLTTAAETDANRDLRAVAHHTAALHTGALSQRNLHLSAVPGQLDTPLSRELQLGDRITLNGRRGIKRVLVVTSIKRTTMNLDDDADPEQRAKFVIVTARDEESRDASPVRFIIDDHPTMDGREATTSSRHSQARAL